MANTFYSYLAFIPPTSDADINILKTNLEKFYSNQKSETQPEISFVDNKVTLTFNGEYNFYICLSNDEHIIDEAKEFAQDTKLDYAEEHFDREKLIISNKRFEIWGDDDYDMDYFNDSLFIIEEVEKFSDIIIFYLSWLFTKGGQINFYNSFYEKTIEIKSGKMELE